MDGLQSLAVLTILEWLRNIDDLAFHAEVPSSEDAPSDDWARGYRDKINGGTAGAIAWLHSLSRRPWPPQAEMTAANLESAVRRLASDALHLVTTIQSSDCWGARYSAWPCAADRELVDRVRSRAAAIRDVVELLRLPVVEAAPVKPLDVPRSMPYLESVDVKILELLAKRPGVAHSQYDLGNAGDRKTVGQRLRHLRTIGYVAHPDGKKKGNVITGDGIARLQSLAESSP